MAARASSSSSEDVFSDESDSHVLNLHDSDGDNSELLEDSRPRPYQFEPVGFNETIGKTARNPLAATPSGSETRTGI